MNNVHKKKFIYHFILFIFYTSLNYIHTIQFVYPLNIDNIKKLLNFHNFCIIKIA